MDVVVGIPKVRKGGGGAAGREGKRTRKVVGDGRGEGHCRYSADMDVVVDDPRLRGGGGAWRGEERRGGELQTQ